MELYSRRKFKKRARIWCRIWSLLEYKRGEGTLKLKVFIYSNYYYHTASVVPDPALRLNSTNRQLSALAKNNRFPTPPFFFLWQEGRKHCHLLWSCITQSFWNDLQSKIKTLAWIIKTWTFQKTWFWLGLQRI